MIRSFKLVLCVIFPCIILYSCGNQKKLAFKQNQAILYKPSTNIVRPEYTIYHNSDSTSQLIIKINLNELLFNQANPENKLMATVKINYQLTDITDNSINNRFTDSSTFIRNFEWVTGKHFVVLNTYIKTKRGNKYRLKINIKDLIRDIGNTSFITIYKTNNFTAQNFKLLLTENNLPIFVNYLQTRDSFKILLNKPVSKLFIKYQKENLPLPSPPFSNIYEKAFSLQYDSIWVVPYSIKKTYTLPYPGLYLIQTDSLTTEGLFLANYGESYPRVNKIKDMIPPVEYLSTSEEFKKLAVSDSLKNSLDKFWLDFSGNIEISRELIRIFYNRMQYANQFFTSYKPGWKTDRGMIYMVFGPPSYIKKTENSETWEYYVKQDASQLDIQFIKTESTYSDNHYLLQHDSNITAYWRDAIESWRKGTAYSLEE